MIKRQDEASKKKLPQGDNCNLKTKSIYLKGYQDDDKGVYIDGCIMRDCRSS
ncbi:hypothetical protein YSY22_34570 [Brevibacillus formosus]